MRTTDTVVSRPRPAPGADRPQAGRGRDEGRSLATVLLAPAAEHLAALGQQLIEADPDRPEAGAPETEDAATGPNRLLRAAQDVAAVLVAAASVFLVLFGILVTLTIFGVTDPHVGNPLAAMGWISATSVACAVVWLRRSASVPVAAWLVGIVQFVAVVAVGVLEDRGAPFTVGIGNGPGLWGAFFLIGIPAVYGMGAGAHALLEKLGWNR